MFDIKSMYMFIKYHLQHLLFGSLNRKYMLCKLHIQRHFNAFITIYTQTLFLLFPYTVEPCYKEVGYNKTLL